MEATAPGVALLIATPCPEQDASVLQVHLKDSILLTRPTPPQDENDTNNGGTVVWLVGEGITIALVRTSGPAPSPSLPNIWPVTNHVLSQLSTAPTNDATTTPKTSSSLDRGGWCREIHLPGGSTIALVASDWLSTPTGRTAVGQYLAATAATTANSRNSNNQQVGEGSPNGDTSIDFLEKEQTFHTNDDNDQTNDFLPPLPAPPKFPSLSVKILEKNGKRRPFPLNTRVPVPFETDLFRGSMFVLVRPPPPHNAATKDTNNNSAADVADSVDPFWNERIFARKKRRLVINIQGQFVRQPVGVVYAGAEMTDPKMQLGLLTRGLAKVLLKLVERFNANMHYSFGHYNTTTNNNNNIANNITNDDDDDPDLEVPHIVAPAFTFFERLVTTPAGETPPSMYDAFEETPESIACRKKTTSFGTWNTTDTYSFSFYSMYIDLPSWKLVGLPASGDIGLETFWGKSMLRICMYEKTGTASDKHWQKENQYAFSVQMKFLGKHGRTDIDDEYSSEEEEEGRSIIFWTERSTSKKLILDRESLPRKNTMEHSESELFFSLSDQSSLNNGETDLSFFDAREDHTVGGDESPPVYRTVTTPLTKHVSAAAQSPCDILSEIDYACPFSLDISLPNWNGGYAKHFAIASTSSTLLFVSERACDEFVNNSALYSEISRTVKDNFSTRMSSSERLRRCIGLALSRETPENVASFHSRTKPYNDFLRRPKPTLFKTLICGFVGRALSDRHWVEECAYVTFHNVAFYRPDKRQPEFLVSLSSVSKVEKLSRARFPQLKGYHVLVLTTLGRSVYLMLTSDTEVQAWHNAIDKQRIIQQNDSDSVSSIESTGVRLLEIDCSADEFLHKSAMWNCKNRKILNCGQFFFQQDPPQSSLLLAEETVTSAVKVVGFENAEQRRTFLDCAAKLKVASVYDLDEASRLTFYLNVYHIMICHAFLVLGPPDSSLKWISYFNNIAYQVGDDIFSLTELEHSIIRAKMSFPTQFLSRFVIPKSEYKTTLTRADYRINFALNCGSVSNPPNILIYNVETLNEQLNEASRLYLASVTHRRNGSGDLEIKLPKICQWFADDFGSTRESLLNKIERFLPDDVRKQLAGCRLPPDDRIDMSSCTIRYSTFNFECKPLSF